MPGTPEVSKALEEKALHPNVVTQQKNPVVREDDRVGPNWKEPLFLLLGLEVQEPPAVIPLERHFTPSQRNLRVGVEGADVGPGGG